MYTLEDLKKAIDILGDADLDSNDIDQIDEILIVAAQKKVALEGIMDAHEEGQMSDEEANAAIAEVITESAEADLDVFDLEIELEASSEDYSNNPGELISFSQAMGGTVANLIAHDYASPEAGKQAIAQATGLSYPEIDSIILGDAVPDTATANAMTACFSATQTDTGFKEFMGLAGNAYAEAAQGQDEQQVVTIDPETNQLRAEFNALKEQKQLGDSLRVLEKHADRLVQSGYLTPREKNLLLGQEQDREDAVALFSQACAAENTPVATQIDRVRFYLDMTEKRGQFGRLDEMTLDLEDPNVVITQEVQDYTEGFVQRNGFI